MQTVPPWELIARNLFSKLVSDNYERGETPPSPSVLRRIRHRVKKAFARRHGISRYRPHQGEAECARRRAQYKRWMTRPSPPFVPRPSHPLDVPAPRPKERLGPLPETGDAATLDRVDAVPGRRSGWKPPKGAFMSRKDRKRLAIGE